MTEPKKKKLAGIRARIGTNQGKLKEKRDSLQELATTSITNKIGAKAELCKARKLIERLTPEYEDFYNLIREVAENDESDAALEEFYATEDLISECKMLCDTVEETLKPSQTARPTSPASVTDSTEHGTKAVKLPKISLPTFNGEIIMFNEFWEGFQTVHSNEELDDASKFQYLAGLLKGPAKDLIAGMSKTAANYAVAIENLTKRYGGKERVANAHFEALRTLSKPTEDRNSLKFYRDKVQMHHSSLKAMGYDFNACETCKKTQSDFVYWNLPYAIQVRLSDKTPNETGWRLPALMSALDLEIERLETLNLASLKGKTPSTGQPEWRRSDRPNWRASTSETDKPKTMAVHACQTTSLQCEFCRGTHLTEKCAKFKTREERVQYIRTNSLCFRCIKPGHRVPACPQARSISCRLCKGTGHHSALCNSQFETPYEKKKYQPKGQESHKSVGMVLSIDHAKGAVSLPTAFTELIHSDGTTPTRVLLDQGSQQTFIRKEVAQNCERIGSTVLRIHGFRSKGPEEEFEVVKVNVKTRNKTIEIDAVVIDEMPEHIEVIGQQETDQLLREKGRHLADDSSIACKIGLLIGADHLYEFVPPPLKIGDQVLIPSAFGDLKSGPSGSTPRQSNTVTICEVAAPPVRDVDRLWDLDAIGIHAEEAHPDDKRALAEFNASIRYEGGSYTARLPWKAGHAPLPDNFGLAKVRLDANLKKLRRDESSNALEIYDEVIQDQLERGFIEKVEPEQEPAGEHCHYLAHHAVKKDSNTTPIRVVFDCSAKSSPELPSLNDCLYSGPAMVPEMPQILMRFRIGPCAASADIAKAYLMIGLDERDRDATRFLWPKDVSDPKSDILTYRFKVVLFGATCSQFILNATIDRHLEQDQNEDNMFIDKVRKGIYIDNLLMTTPNEHQLLSAYDGSKRLLGSAGLHLREWASNVPLLRDKAMENEEADTREEVPLLGLRWDTSHDTLRMTYREIDTTAPTKRKIVSGLATQFDPLGLVTPVTVKGKMLVKELWENKLDWDELVPERLQEEWEHLSRELGKLHEIKIKRQIHMDGVVTLHTFCDASTKAYGAAVYCVQNGESNLVMAKAKIAPSKKLSIPKLELTAAVIGSRLVKYVRGALEGILPIKEIHMWSDSNVALGWIHANSPLEAYAQNRKVEIGQNIPEAKWHFVPTEHNPADKMTRGIKLAKLSDDDMWWHGPSFIREQTAWEEIKPPRPKRVDVYATTTKVQAKDRDSLLDTVAERCGTLRKLIRVIGFVRRFISNLKTRRIEERERSKRLSSEEHQAAKRWIIRTLQEENFGDERRYLSAEKPPKGKTPSLIPMLRLAMREDLIVCDSRLTQAEIEDSAKYPVLLPSKHRVTTLLIEQIHQEKHHVGVNSVLATLRQHWWIPKGRQRVKHVIRACMICRKERGAPYAAPPVPPLPAVRVALSRPFTVVGVDYGGPLMVRNKEKEKGKEALDEKRYFALFTCASTRAVHIEVVPDLSAEAFLRAFQRFCARRSYPSLMLSDNGTNFVASAEILKTWEKAAEVKEHLNHKGCKWKFIPGRAPWFGGFWERMIGLTKKSLAKALGRSLVTDDVLRTVMSEIEAQINDRPLTTVSDDVNDLQPLTPSMLAYGHRLDSLPVPAIEPGESEDPSFKEKELLTQRQKHAERIRENYYQRWYREYLTQLRLTENSTRTGRSPEIGEVVQIHDDGHRLQWRLGLVSRLHPGPDGHVRSCSIRTTNGVITRPVKALYPLELRMGDVDDAILDPPVAHPRPPLDRQSERVAGMSELVGHHQLALVPGLLDSALDDASEPPTTADPGQEETTEPTQGNRGSRVAAQRARKRITEQMESE